MGIRRRSPRANPEQDEEFRAARERWESEQAERKAAEQERLRREGERHLGALRAAEREAAEAALSPAQRRRDAERRAWYASRG
jgi:hypothetical protein